MRRLIAIAAALACLLPFSTAGQDGRAPIRTELAPGIFLFSTPPYGDVGLDGNAIAILSTDGVLVFDSNGTPAAAAAVLSQIRTLTSQPIRYVVNSHWHWDHWYGTETYQRAFPDVRIVAHEKTRAMMMGPALDFNRPGVEQQLPGYIQSIEKRVAGMEAADPAAPELPALKRLLAEDRFFLQQKAGVRHAFPNLTYSHRLTIDMGERRIEVLNFGRAVTPGDTVVYLPSEKISCWAI